MLSKVFNDTRPQSFFSLLLVGVVGLLGLGFYLWPLQGAEVKWLEKNFHTSGPFQFAAYSIVLFLNVFFLNKKITDSFEVLKRNYFTGWFYLWFSLLVYVIEPTAWLQVINFVFIALWVHLFRLPEAKNNHPILFNLGILIALLFWLAPPLIWLIIPVVVSMLIYSVQVVRQYFLVLMGFFMLQLILFTVLFWLDIPLVLQQKFTALGNIALPVKIIWSISSLLWLAMLALFFFFSLPDITSTLKRANIYIRKVFSVSLFFLITIVLVSVLYSSYAFLLLGVTIPIMSLFSANLLQCTRRKWIFSFYFLLPPLVFIFAIWIIN